MPYKDKEKAKAYRREWNRRWREKNRDYFNKWRAEHKDYFKEWRKKKKSDLFT